MNTAMVSFNTTETNDWNVSAKKLRSGASWSNTICGMCQCWLI